MGRRLRELPSWAALWGASWMMAGPWKLPAFVPMKVKTLALCFTQRHGEPQGRWGISGW